MEKPQESDEEGALVKRESSWISRQPTWLKVGVVAGGGGLLIWLAAALLSALWPVIVAVVAIWGVYRIVRWWDRDDAGDEPGPPLLEEGDEERKLSGDIDLARLESETDRE